VLVTICAAAAACGDDDRADAGGAPDPPDTPVTSSPPSAVPSPRPPVSTASCRRLGRRLPGRRLVVAERMAHEARCPLRVVRRDGLDLPVTEDFSPSRINVAVRAGRVVRMTGLF